MSRELIVRSVAEAELADAFDWYEDRVPGLGSDFLLSVDAVLNAIARNPQQYPIIHKTIHRALTKRFPYEILFVVEEKRIVVLAVFHAKRDPENWQDRY
ncbi:MAG: type II toxin-antitoxin system RelE/ParE family toxin [Verrucomicrobiae bacterium]|nr:type II toxin-antitoxin system RelE/ParE family toxin [Verrucomicrobiae bacterium]